MYLPLNWRLAANRALVRFAILVIVYVVVAATAYRFRFPDKSETRLFLDTPKALVWDWRS